MDWRQRNREQNLTRILANHAYWEQRTMHDLVAAGFSFTSITQARRFASAQKKLREMSYDETVEKIARGL